MFYTYEWADGKGRSTIRFNLERIEARVLDRHSIYVVPTTPERRAQLIDRLEANGFTCDEHWGCKREEVISGDFRFPSASTGKPTTTWEASPAPFARAAAGSSHPRGCSTRSAKTSWAPCQAMPWNLLRIGEARRNPTLIRQISSASSGSITCHAKTCAGLPFDQNL